VSWDRATVAAALVELVESATGGVKCHPLPPETLNGPCVVVMRPQPVVYATAGLGVDEATLPLAVVSGIEQEAAIDSLKQQVTKAILADPTLGGLVVNCWPSEERNWRNVTGAGGIQLLLVELILMIHM
jgi:hypothetical protein